MSTGLDNMLLLVPVVDKLTESKDYIFPLAYVTCLHILAHIVAPGESGSSPKLL